MNKEIENRFLKHFESIKESSLNDKTIYKFEGDEFVDEDIFNDENSKDTSLHLDLLPQPFVGDVKNAKIIICSLNPGFDKENYNNEEYIKEHIKKQFSQDEHPSMFWLENDENIKNTGGAKWWRGKLNQKNKTASLVYNIAQEYNKENPDEKIEAVFEWLSNNMAAIELFPYHSKSFKESLLKKCESTKIIKEYVHEVLIPEAKEGKRLICFTRSFRLWSEDYTCVREIAAKNSNVICSPNPRCVTFNVNIDAFGRKIFDFIKCNYGNELTQLFEE